MNYLLVPVIAVIIAFLGLKLFRWWKVLDKPGNDLKNTRKPVPTIQWIFVYLGFFIAVALLFPQYLHNNLFWGLIVGSLPIVVFELLEELNYIGKIKFKIPPAFRLVGHIGGALLAVRIGSFGPQEFIINGHLRIMPQWLLAIGFAFWAILCINAINRFDGIYAQASGVSSIGFLTIFLLIQFVVFKSYTNFSEVNMQTLLFVKNISFVLFCISLVSTVVEYKPLGLLRDVGIMFFWFSLAYLSVVGWAKIGTLIVALSLVIFDAIWVWLWRIFVMKKNPVTGDYTHLHHRLLWLWRTRKEVRWFVWIWSLIMMIFILIQWTNRENKIIIFVVMALVFFGINYYLFLVKKLPCGLDLKKNN
jgi:UDP-GlcNAc:undecaprenyl-phosphate/decaprenyl-phosphate GlcNAc-1-phosphate transferase